MQRAIHILFSYFKQYWSTSWNWRYGNCFTFNSGANQSGYRLPVFRTSKPGPNYGKCIIRYLTLSLFTTWTITCKNANIGFLIGLHFWLLDTMFNPGLTIDINIEQSQYVPELSDEAGANIIIHNANQMPFPHDEGITVPPGFSTSIAIRKVRMIA